MRNLARGTYVLTRESSSSFSLEVLDIHFWKGPGFASSGRFSFAPKFKPACTMRYLSADSFHSDQVHASWPLAQVGRIRRLSCSPRVFKESLRVLANRFSACLVSAAACKKVMNSPFVEAVSKKATNNRTSYLVIPFHPSFANIGFEGFLKQIVSRWQCELHFNFNLDDVRLCFASCTKSLLAFTRSEQRI